MEREDIERLKIRFTPIIEEGRNFFGKETFDNHVKDVFEYFGYDVDDKEIKEIIGF